MKKQIDYRIVSIIFGVLVVCFAMAFYALAQCTEPTSRPPGGNVPTPLNTGSAGQLKVGGLILNTGGFPTGLIVDQGNPNIGPTNLNGKLDVNGTIYQREGQLYADYVFEPDSKLESIEEYAEYIWNNKHLKAVPKVEFNENEAGNT